MDVLFYVFENNRVVSDDEYAVEIKGIPEDVGVSGAYEVDLSQTGISRERLNEFLVGITFFEKKIPSWIKRSD